MTADLGRHIKNGEVFFQTGEIVKTNYYSYTEPNLPVLNHHWLSGNFYYLINKFFGFSGLSVFFALTMGITIYLLFQFAQENVGFITGLSIVVLCLPFILMRLEVRPEAFSCLFFALFFILLEKLKRGIYPFKVVLPIMFVIQLLWVNLHIFFILGNFIVAVFLLIALLEKNNNLTKNYFYIFTCTFIASLITPWGIHSILEPLMILNGYGIQVVENMPFFYLMIIQSDKVAAQTSIINFLVVSTLGLVSPLLFKKFYSLKTNYIWLLIFIMFALVTAKIMRFSSIFGIYSIIFFTLLIASKSSLIEYIKKVFTFILPLALLAMLLSQLTAGNYGVGVLPNTFDSANFFKTQNIKGPVLNNFDNGGYLIFNLFPNEKVYIDGRPEAYSSEFKKYYGLEIFEANEVFKTQHAKYNFNSIFLPVSSMDTRTMQFVKDRLSSDEWKAVFMDKHAIILVKNSNENKNVIEKYEILDVQEKLSMTKYSSTQGVSDIWLFLIKVFS